MLLLRLDPVRSCLYHLHITPRVSTLCDSITACTGRLLCHRIQVSMSITCFTGGGDFGVDLYIASLIGGTMSGNAMPANHTHTHVKTASISEAVHASLNEAYPLLISYNSK